MIVEILFTAKSDPEMSADEMIEKVDALADDYFGGHSGQVFDEVHQLGLAVEMDVSPETHSPAEVIELVKTLITDGIEGIEILTLGLHPETWGRDAWWKRGD